MGRARAARRRPTRACARFGCRATSASTWRSPPAWPRRPAPGSSSWTATCRIRPRRSRACTPRRRKATTSCSRGACSARARGVRDHAGRLYFRLLNLVAGTAIDRSYGTFSIISRQVAAAYLQFRDRDRHYLFILYWLGFNQATIDVPRRAAALRHELLRHARAAAPRARRAHVPDDRRAALDRLRRLRARDRRRAAGRLLRRVAPHARLGARLDEHRDDAAAADRVLDRLQRRRRPLRRQDVRAGQAAPAVRHLRADRARPHGGRARSRDRARAPRRADPHGHARRASLDRVRRRRLLQPRAGDARAEPPRRRLVLARLAGAALRDAARRRRLERRAEPAGLRLRLRRARRVPRRARPTAATTPATTSRRRWCSTARRIVGERAGRRFTSDLATLAPADLVVASGIFNVKLDVADGDWQRYVDETIATLGALARRRLAFNLLPPASSPQLERADLHYADRDAVVALCAATLGADDVAVREDYGLWEFTVVVTWDGGAMTARPRRRLRRRRLRPRRRPLPRGRQPARGRRVHRRRALRARPGAAAAACRSSPSIASRETHPPAEYADVRGDRLQPRQRRARRDRRALPRARLRARQLPQLARDALGGHAAAARTRSSSRATSSSRS